MISKINKDVKNVIDEAYKNPLINGMLTIFLVVYGGHAVESLPQNVLNFFNTPVMKILLIALIAVLVKTDLPNGLLAAVSFVLTMNMTKKYTNSYYENNDEDEDEDEVIDEDEDEDEDNVDNKDDDMNVNIDGGCSVSNTEVPPVVQGETSDFGSLLSN